MKTFFQKNMFKWLMDKRKNAQAPCQGNTSENPIEIPRNSIEIVLH